ncbi:ferritin-like domain-containing protein, partial [Dehalococcoidia bacterium]|nr:ferritin-like domain-containing protein [Dehalococcoidia bacterium]
MATVAQHQTYWERAKEAGFDLSWLNQLEENVVGAEVEDVSDNLTGRVAGSIPRPGVAQYGAYPFRTKKEVWGYNLRKLYEEFVSRQWSSATDIPWDTLEELPDDIEAAECQLATFFAQVEFVAADVPGRFIATMSPDYQEVRMALLGQVMDESRHLEVFRKRALANGGGLMRMI